MVQITIDTCLINSKQKIEEVNLLEHFHDVGLIKIVGTERLLRETENNSKMAEKAISYENISEPIVIGQWRVGHGYVSGNNAGPSFREISAILFPSLDLYNLTENQINDVMHLLSHSHSKSDYFVTNNIWDFINAKRSNDNRNGEYKNHKRLQLEGIGIYVYTPQEILTILKERHGMSL